MDDARLGTLLRAARIRRGWRQLDVAARAGVSDQTVSRLERGQVAGCALETLRRIATVLEIRLDVVARWRGGDGDRLVSARHDALAESVARYLRAAGWDVRPEVSFSVYGERGLIDLLTWYPRVKALLVIELKTEVVDIGELLGTLDRKRRLAPRMARDLGWAPQIWGICVVVADTSANRRRVHAHAGVIRAALPQDGRTFHHWLRSPAAPLMALAFWPSSREASGRPGWRPVRRVRLPRKQARLAPASMPAPIGAPRHRGAGSGTRD